MVKPNSKKPPLPAASNAPSDTESGVQLSRQAQYMQRIDEIYADAKAGRCTFDEAVNRVVEAAMARTNDWFTETGREEAEAVLRAHLELDPQLRKAFGR